MHAVEVGDQLSASTQGFAIKSLFYHILDIAFRSFTSRLNVFKYFVSTPYQEICSFLTVLAKEYKEELEKAKKVEKEYMDLLKAFKVLFIINNAPNQ